MMDKRQVTVSKFLSKCLRHEPELVGLELEPGGWAPIELLLAGAERTGFLISRAELDRVVAEDDKRRFAVDDSGAKIRANQGHSTSVELQLKEVPPPSELYHGTVDRFLPAILAEGLRKMNRHDVHLSADVETAVRVGQRRGRPVVLAIDAARMAADGLTFRLSENGVWLTDHVPPKYLRKVDHP